MAGSRKTHSVPGYGGSHSQDYQQGSNRKAVMVDRWSSEEKYSDGESQTLTQLSSQRTQPIAQSNHFKNILATQRHGEIISHLKQFLTTMSDFSSNQSITTMECQERLDLVFETMEKLATDARRQEISREDQLRNLERELLNARREMKEMSELLRNKCSDNTNLKEADIIRKFYEPVYVRSSVLEPDEGICVADYLTEVRQKRLRSDERSSTTYKTSQVVKQTDKRSTDGSDGYDDLFNEKDSYRNISDNSQGKEQYRSQTRRKFEETVKPTDNSYEPILKHMRTDWLRSEREITIVGVSDYEHVSPRRSAGSHMFSAHSGPLVKPINKREHKPVQWGWDRKDKVELEIEVLSVKRAREELLGSGRDVRARLPQHLESSLDNSSLRRNYDQPSCGKSFSMFADGKKASYDRGITGISRQTPMISYIRRKENHR